MGIAVTIKDVFNMLRSSYASWPDKQPARTPMPQIGTQQTTLKLGSATNYLRSSAVAKRNAEKSGTKYMDIYSHTLTQGMAKTHYKTTSCNYGEYYGWGIDTTPCFPPRFNRAATFTTGKDHYKPSNNQYGAFYHFTQASQMPWDISGAHAACNASAA